MFFVSTAAITFVPRFCRMYLEEWLISLWRLPATPAFTRPDAVILKRFLAPDLVFNFGIFAKEPEPLPLVGMATAKAMPSPGDLGRAGLVGEKVL